MKRDESRKYAATTPRPRTRGLEYTRETGRDSRQRDLMVVGIKCDAARDSGISLHLACHHIPTVRLRPPSSPPPIVHGKML